MLDLVEFANLDNPEAVKDIQLFRQKYGDVLYPPPETHLSALSIRNKLRDLGAEDQTSRAIVSGIISGDLQVSSVAELAEIEVGVLRKVPGMEIEILNDLRAAIWRLPEPTGESEIIVPPTHSSSSGRDTYREREAEKRALIDQLRDLRIPKQAFNILKRHVVASSELRGLESLVNMSDDEFLALPGFGSTSIEKFREAVALKAEEGKQP